MPSDSPPVSAIVIFWNAAAFLEEAVESGFAQTYDHWELLLVDDGSSDGSTDIARRYAEQHPDKVRYIEHPDHANRGMSASRNLGVRSATGDYISYLDGDDAWVPRKLEEQLAIMDAQPEADMVAAPLVARFRWTRDHRDDDSDQLYGVGANGKHPYSDTLVEPPRLLALFLRHEQYFPNGFLVKREVMARTGVYEEQFRGAYSDAVALVKLCLTSAVFVSSKRWYLYRKHAASNTHQSIVQGKGDEQQRMYLSWIETYFNQIGLHDPKLRRILRMMLFRSRHPHLQRAEHAARQLPSEAYQFLRRGMLLLTSPFRPHPPQSPGSEHDHE